MTKSFFSTIIATGGLAGESFDINLGPLETDVIDVLLSSSSATFPSELQVNTPLSLVSTGSLGSPRALDISGIENDGRLFFLSVRNDDLDTNSLTILSGNSINGNSSLVITQLSDLVFVHTTGGVWRVQVVYTPEEKSNLELELEFKASQLSNFKSLSYTGSRLTTVNIYTDSGLSCCSVV